MRAHQGNTDVARRHTRPMRRRRKGATSVEFAVVAPVFFTITLSVFQFGALMLTQNVLTASAREGCRVAALSSTTSTSTVTTAVNNRLSSGGVDPGLVTVNVTPTTLSGLAAGSEVRVTVSAQIADLAFFWPGTAPSPTLTSQMTYHRE